MEKWFIKPSSLSGTLFVPSSKSQSIRALFFGLLGRGKTVIENLLPSQDIDAMLLVCKQLGACVVQDGKKCEIVGLGGKIEGSEDVIFAGNSGLILRFIGALGALSSYPLVLTGDDSIRNNREVSPLIDALTQLGVRTFSLRKKGGAPLFVQGPFTKDHATFLGRDSQPVSALLATSIFAPFPIHLRVVDPGEKPWVALTLDWLDKLGARYCHRDFEEYRIEGNHTYEGFHYCVPGDYSSAAFSLAAAAITGSEITIENLDPNEKQADKKFLSLLTQMGVEIAMETQTITIKKCKELKGIEADINDCIDSLPLLAVLGCYAEGKTHLTNARIARKKESDRISSIAQELRKMGAKIEEEEDGLLIYPSKLNGAQVESHLDHRIAMSLAVAALQAKGETEILQTSCVKKTYPEFVSHFQTLGADIRHG